MKLQGLSITDIRNVRAAKLEQLSATNLFYGDNGAGKTSVLEAIYFLGMARSFRSARVKPFINYEADMCRVVATFSEDEKRFLVGIERARRGGFTIKINGKLASSAAELARLIPLQLLNADTFALLDGGPKERRQLIDWGVFHVEHSFFSIWSRSKKAIKQRNSLLRKGLGAKELSSQLAPWDRELAETSLTINRMRRAYINRFIPVFSDVLADILSLEAPLELAFKDGWQRDGSPMADADEYIQCLQNGLGRDLKSGLTHLGPHRADLAFTVNGLAASDVLSRGQQKLTVAAMKLAQSRLFSEDTGRKSLLLADDIPAEIDLAHQAKLFRLMADEGMQIFLTSVSETLEGFDPKETSVFHVKHGAISPVS